MKLCTVEGCENPHNAKGMCRTHYQRFAKYGTTDSLLPTPQQRFWSKVDNSGECWEWTAGKSFGYGNFSVNRKSVMAHRFSYEMENGPIPEDKELDHICRSRGCVRPSHLRVVTSKQNNENYGGPHGHNLTSGVRGVYRSANKWQARVTHFGKIYTAGNHATIAEAEVAVIALRNQLFTHNNLDRQQQAA